MISQLIKYNMKSLIIVLLMLLTMLMGRVC